MNLSLAEIFYEASRLGLTVRLVPGGFLEVAPAKRVPDGFLAVVRDNKDELKKWLRARASRHHIIRQVLCGDFGCADSATVDRVAAQLQALTPSAARNAALVRLAREVSK